MLKNNYKVLHKAVNDFKAKLEAFEKVEAQLSKETVLNVLTCLKIADDVFDKGFVESSCEEINETHRHCMICSIKPN